MLVADGMVDGVIFVADGMVGVSGGDGEGDISGEGGGGSEAVLVLTYSGCR